MSNSVSKSVGGDAGSYEGGELMCEGLQELRYQTKPAAEQTL